MLKNGCYNISKYIRLFILNSDQCLFVRWYSALWCCWHCFRLLCYVVVSNAPSLLSVRICIIPNQPPPMIQLSFHVTQSWRKIFSLFVSLSISIQRIKEDGGSRLQANRAACLLVCCALFISECCSVATLVRSSFLGCLFNCSSVTVFYCFEGRMIVFEEVLVWVLMYNYKQNIIV